MENYSAKIKIFIFLNKQELLACDCACLFLFLNNDRMNFPCIRLMNPEIMTSQFMCIIKHGMLGLPLAPYLSVPLMLRPWLITDLSECLSVSSGILQLARQVIHTNLFCVCSNRWRDMHLIPTFATCRPNRIRDNWGSLFGSGVGESTTELPVLTGLGLIHYSTILLHVTFFKSVA